MNFSEIMKKDLFFLLHPTMTKILENIYKHLFFIIIVALLIFQISENHIKKITMIILLHLKTMEKILIISKDLMSFKHFEIFLKIGF